MTSNVRPFDPPAQVPPVSYADHCRDAVSARCSDLEATRPEAVDLAAEVIAALHAHLHGCATALRGHRGPGYRRQQLRGEHPITIEDLAQLATEPTREAHEALASALSLLAHAINCRLDTNPRPLSSVPEAAAALAEGVSPVLGSIFRALEDGRVDAVEREQIRAALGPLKAKLAILEGSL